MSEAPVVLITGGADGLGWAMAQLFAKRDYHVVIADVDGDKASERAAELGENHEGHHCDVTIETDVKSLVATLQRCDVLINNAGIADSPFPTVDQPLEHFQKVLAVHLSGTFVFSREIGAKMIAAGHGAIVNVSSIAGLGGLPRRNAYSAAKAGIAMITRTMACEWAKYGLRVNAVAPAYVDTALVRRIVEAGRIDIDGIQRRTPLGRLISPNEVSEAVYFLASPTASGITGATLAVDGGWSAYGDYGDASEVH